VADSVYGNSPDFLAAIDACVGATALVSISSETRCWPQRPATQEQAYRDKGAERAKRHLRPTAVAPQSVAALAASLPAWQWYRRKVSEGTKGPIEYDFARHRVTVGKDGLPERTVWLVIKRTRGPEPVYAYAISNAPASTPFRTLVWLSGIRWAVEQCFEEGKTELGMAHYEVRKYAGWQHHMLLTMLAHFFLWHLKGCSSATTLIMKRLEFGGQEFSKRPDMIGQSSGHSRCSVVPLGLDQSRGMWCLIRQRHAPTHVRPCEVVESLKEDHAPPHLGAILTETPAFANQRRQGMTQGKVETFNQTGTDR
jgi:hypothetical protein